MKSFISFLIMSLVVISLSGCGGSSGGGASSGATNNGVSALSAREVAIDSTGNITLVHMSTPKKSFLDIFISAAYAALFVDIEPYFSTNMAAVSITDSSCASYKGDVSCDDNGTLSEAELKEQITIFPLVAVDNTVDGVNNEDVPIVTLVEDKYYHLTVMRRGGGIPNQSNIVATAHADCPFTIANQNGGGDIIIKTNNNITANVSATIYRRTTCTLTITGNFEGYTGISKSFSIHDFLDVGDLVADPNNEDSSLYPGISELRFDNQSVTGSSVSINYTDFTEAADGYRYGEWEIVESGTGTAITKTFWLLSHGNGGLQKWLSDTADITNSYVDIDTYSKCSGACPVGVVDPYGATSPNPLWFPWQVGTSGEMLLLVSAKDANNVMIQKKVAITAQ